MEVLGDITDTRESDTDLIFKVWFPRKFVGIENEKLISSVTAKEAGMITDFS